MTGEDLLARRRRLLGPSLSLSYREPLTIVRGEGAHLIDAEGRAYLDLVNNVAHVGHGTTVATNLVIERKGALTGLLTTKGFRDVLEIGRQTRPHLYDYSRGKPPPLVTR